MTTNELVKFWTSEPVEQLLAEANQKGYLNVTCGKISLGDEHLQRFPYKAENKNDFYFSHGLQKMFQFVDDVVHDRFDLITLSVDQLTMLQKYFGKDDTYYSLMYRCDEYAWEMFSSHHNVLLLPEYFCFTISPQYDLREISSDDFYGLLSDTIDLCKNFNEHPEYLDVFKSNLKAALKHMKELDELGAK